MMKEESVKLEGQNRPEVLAFRSKRYVVTVGVSSHRHKVLQIIFGRADTSLFVNFPYFRHSKGLVSLVTFPGNTKLPTNLSLEPGGKVTSHRVKYAHHLNGRAHFSQTGRVLPLVRKSSIPLAKAEGHLFTIQLQGLGDFEVADPKKDSGPPTSRRTVLNFHFGESEPEAVKIVGRWYSRDALSSRIQGIVRGPNVVCETPAGKRYSAFLLAPLNGVPAQDYVLLLTCEGIPCLDKEERSVLTFIGGFDYSDIINDLSRDTTFLALSYPVSNPIELSRRLGSIDYIKKLKG